MKTGIVLAGLFTLAFLGTPPARSATEAPEETIEPIYRKEVVTMGHDVEIKENEIVKEMDEILKKALVPEKVQTKPEAAEKEPGGKKGRSESAPLSLPV